MSSSSIRCRGPWKIHKRCSEPDRWLDEMGFYRKHTARDSSCLFRAVSENIYNTQKYYHKVRMECVKFMATRRELFEGSLDCPFENYLKEMANPSEWGGLVEISAMSQLYSHDFVIFEANKGPQTKISNGYEKTIYLFRSTETKHYDAVYTKEFINASSFCQSLVYEILYEGVYQLKELPYAVDKMLHDKIATNHIEYFMAENVERRKRQKERAKIFIDAPNSDDKDRNNNAVALKCKHHTEDLERASLLKESLSIFVFNRSLIQLENVCMNCLNVNSAKDLIDNGITPFPYKVAKALDPDIYRNIEFDVWSELRKEMRFGIRYSDGTTLQVGVKCLCKLPEQTVAYHCHIQEMRPDGGPCLVFIEDLGEKRVVNYDQLEPLPQEEVRPWAPPYRYSRTNSQFLTLTQMLQQIGSVTRKQGLKVQKKKEEAKTLEKAIKLDNKESWREENGSEGLPMAFKTDEIHFPTYQHLDYVNFEPMPVEVQALPLMVDCRPAGAAAHEIANGAPSEGHHAQPAQSSTSGEMAGHGVTSQAARASTPATTTTTFAGNAGNGAAYGPACGPYACGVKSVVWCGPHSPPPHAHVGPAGPGGPGGPAGPGAPGLGPHAHAAMHAPLLAPPVPPLPPHVPPPPPGISPHVHKSILANGADLPMNDIATLRYYFNLGVDCMWSLYGPPPPPHIMHQYSPRDIAQDMQQMSLHDRANHNGNEHNQKHKPNSNDKPQVNNQGKGNGQRPLLGPRFKRGGNNPDGSQTTNHNPNKGHNNNMGNKGPNNRRNSHVDVRGVGVTGGVGAYGEPPECVVEGGMVSLPYIPYPPPIYPIPYYPVDSDPSMMGMMGGIGYVGYEEGMEYGASLQSLQYYGPPPPHYPPPHQHHQHHQEHNSTERAAHPSRAQIDALLLFLEQNRSLAKGFPKVPSARDKARKKWQEVSPSLNNLGGSMKTWKQWTKYWADKKSAVKKKAILRSEERRNSEAGTEEVVELTDVEERIISLMGGESFTEGNKPSANNTFASFVPAAQHRQPSPTQDFKMENSTSDPLDEITSMTNADSPISMMAEELESNTNAGSPQAQCYQTASPHQYNSPTRSTQSPRHNTIPHRRRRLLPLPSQRRSQFLNITHRFLRVEEQRLELDRRIVTVMEDMSSVMRELLQRDRDRNHHIGQGLLAIGEGLKLLARNSNQ
ncbi:protein ovarian tumor locus-like [Achroia grisella]|uniref:protein ovarian tumor locus-like n=1 Tax=Achroia grisella TaxID=688607 RepID=UPI0027D307A3|nr:protein ovarian tumor locus-like [Achroia grisella]